MDTAHIRLLLDKRDEIDREILAIVNGSTPSRKPVVCSICEGEGHTARTCARRRSASANGDGRDPEQTSDASTHSSATS